MKKIILTALLVAGVPLAAYAEYQSKIYTDNVVVEGQITEVGVVDDVYVLLEKDGDVKYINNFEVASNGKYLAKFKFAPESDISDYTVRVKAGNEDATDSVLSAASQKEAMVFTVDLKNNNGTRYIDDSGIINISGNIKNYFSDAGKCSIIAAVYSSNGVLLSAQKREVDFTYDVDNTLNSWSINASEGDKVKVFVWDSEKTMIPFADASTVAHQTYGADVMSDTNSDITAVFLGDSIYAGTGATSADASLVGHMSKYFNDTYNSATVINAGIGGTYSDQGMYRIKKDVAKYNPDIVFVDYAVNDRYLSEEGYRAYMEGIARELIKLPHQPVIVFNFPAIYVINDHNYPENTYWAEEIADYYGIKTVNYYDYIQQRISNGDFADIKEFAEIYTTDNTHPNDVGYELMAEHLIAAIEDGSAYKKYELKDLNGSYEFNNPGLLAASDDRVSYAGSWQYKAEATASTFEDGSYLSTNGGDTISFTFTGKSIGVYVIRSANGNTAKYSIDNGKYTGNINTNGAGPMPMVVFEKHGLDEGEHTITITTDIPSEASKNEFEIGYFLTDEKTN